MSWLFSSCLFLFSEDFAVDRAHSIAFLPEFTLGSAPLQQKPILPRNAPGDRCTNALPFNNLLSKSLSIFFNKSNYHSYQQQNKMDSIRSALTWHLSQISVSVWEFPGLKKGPAAFMTMHTKWTYDVCLRAKNIRSLKLSLAFSTHMAEIVALSKWHQI